MITKKTFSAGAFFYALGALTALIALPPAPAQAEDGANYLSLGAGYYDIMDDDGAADFRVEYRSGEKYFWLIQPWGGVEFTAEGTIWAGAGALANIPIQPNIYLTPSFGAGLYTEGASDKDLDFPIEFRSQIEAAYQFPGNRRIGLAFSHTSNMSLGDSNPGTETLGLYYHVPVGSLF